MFFGTLTLRLIIFRLEWGWLVKVIGLTGGIGSGKSTVSQILAELGVVVIDADKVGHEALKPDTEVWREIVVAFGEDILTSTGDIDRKKLAGRVFRDASSLARLSRIMHPRMYDMVRAQLEGYRRQGTNVVILEAPLLLEAGWTSLVDEVWVTLASESTVLKRLEQRSELSESEALARIGSQLSLLERISRADVVINTDCELKEVRARVWELWQGLQSPKAKRA